MLKVLQFIKAYVFRGLGFKCAGHALGLMPSDLGCRVQDARLKFL